MEGTTVNRREYYLQKKAAFAGNKAELEKMVDNPLDKVTEPVAVTPKIKPPPPASDKPKRKPPAKKVETKKDDNA